MAMVMENQQPVAQLVVPRGVAPPLPPPPPPPSLPQAYKHHCKVCKKGFMCGRALGGHMRAHGVTDDVLDDDAAAQCGGGTGDDASEAASPSAKTNKRMYALRANPGRLKSYRVCENCGKEFTSWKSLLDHGRCSYHEEEDDETEGVRRSPPLLRNAADDDGEDEVEADLALAPGWSKGKRTRRGKLMEVANGSVTEVATSPSSEEEDLANCLVMLSSSSRSVQPSPVVVVDADQESCALASKDAERNRLLGPHPISMMAPTTMPELKLLAPPQQLASTVPRGLFECKACKKVFTSHQALGGHRASHKNVKGCFAARLESNRSEPPQPATAAPAAVADISADANTAEGNPMNSRSSAVVMATAAPETPVMQVNEAPAPSAGSPIKKKGKVHECSICHRVFMSGQALGGHKRCHWLTTGSGDPTGAVAKLHAIFAQDHVMHAKCQQLTVGRSMLDTAHPILDLNLPMNRSAEPTATKAKQAAELKDSVLCLNAPASLYMQSWTVHSNASNVNKTAATSSRNDAAGAKATEDEADSRNAKKGKIISDLKDMSVAGETSPWLQVGIALPSESNEKGIQE